VDDVLLRSRADAVLTLTFNRPDKLNAFDNALRTALLDALVEAERDPAVRVVVLAGSGRAFSAGQDLEQLIAAGGGEIPASVGSVLRSGFNRIATLLRTMEKPVIASFGGAVAGIGLSLALCSDVRLAADDSKLTLGFSRIGLLPDGGATVMLPLLAGLGRALELAWTSDVIDAQEAHRLGLVNHVVPAADLAAETAKLAQRLASSSATALALTKRAFNAAVCPNFADVLEREATLQEIAAAGPDARAGITAFLERRAARKT
jgi:2-(1,2-epoxy-1,2-dihydrophenyl)acetyl-CoA isomerase